MRHYMKDMPPEWLAEMEASPAWSAIARTVAAYRADAQSLAWAQRALEDGALDVTVPVLTMYGAETFPEMPVAAASIVAAVPKGTEKEMPGAMHSWEPEPMVAELAEFARACAGVSPRCAVHPFRYGFGRDLRIRQQLPRRLRG